MSVLRGHLVFSSPPQRPMTSRLRRIFYSKFDPLHLFSFFNSWERASIFPFECSVLNKGTTGTIFITSLVWRGPWLGIEHGTSCTRSQHYTTRLSKRRKTHYFDNTNSTCDNHFLETFKSALSNTFYIVSNFSANSK